MARWPSEHRRLLTATTVLVMLIAAVLVLAVAGSSAAHPRGQRHSLSLALASSQRQLAAADAQLSQLQALSAKQAAEISGLEAELRMTRRNHHTHRHRR